jgi:hypothetical protein
VAIALGSLTYGGLTFPPSQSHAISADTINFPNEEVLYAEQVWERFAYSREFGIFSPAYFRLSNLTWEDTPELYWYFPYFIGFCKGNDLLSYQTKAKGDFSAYELLINDFQEYYEEKSGYRLMQVQVLDGNFNIVSSSSVNTYLVVKNGENWEIRTTNEPIDVIQIIPPISENPFEEYKIAEITTTTTTTTTTAITTNSTQAFARTTTKSTTKNSDNTGKKDIIQVVLIAIIGGVVILGGIITGIILTKKSDKNDKK